MSIVIPAAVLAAIVLRPGSHGTSSSNQVIAPGAPTRATIGSKAPDFTLPDLNGTQVRLSHFRGRPVVLTFFASWCNPCEHDMPVLEKEQQSHGNNVAIVGVNKIVVRPVWDGTAFVPRKMMNLSSSFDHRVVDGYEAATFIQRIKELMETPALIFMEG